MTRSELKQWLRTHIAERRTWRPISTDDTCWLHWATHWLRQLETASTPKKDSTT